LYPQQRRAKVNGVSHQGDNGRGGAPDRGGGDVVTTTTSLAGQRVRVDGRVGQLNGWNQETGLVTMWDEVERTQVVFTALGQPVAAPLTCREGHEARRLFPDASSDSDEPVLCAEHSRPIAQRLSKGRVASCDKCGHEGAWRNPYTRRNEYLCAVHHAESGDGVIQNKWAGAGRVTGSAPLGVREREACVAAGVGSDCRGEVRPRGREAQPLCNAHAGRVSAGEGLADRDWSVG
jgi:hypothetical protein